MAGNLGPCPVSVFCDFDSEDICGFTNYQFGVFNWTRTRPLGFSSSGPNYDHVSHLGGKTVPSLQLIYLSFPVVDYFDIIWPLHVH